MPDEDVLLRKPSMVSVVRVAGRWQAQAITYLETKRDLVGSRLWKRKDELE